MLQYLPWSEKTLKYCICEEKKGCIPVLDLELTAKCSAASCIYCDSMPIVCSNPTINELSMKPTLDMLKQAANKGLKWIYTCGLGEPLEDKRFFEILDFISANDISMSIFTNGQFISNQSIANKLKQSNVNLILKMDTFDENRFDTILGGKGRAKKIYKAIDYLLGAGYTDIKEKDCTDLAFSIVPTKLTKETIPEVVDFCIRHNIFPSVGELENAGNVVNYNLMDTLGLSEEGLKEIRNKSELTSKNYMRPICPAILTGLHIDNQGNCIVDEVTGFNCKWFLLSNPKTKILGNISNETVEELHKKVTEYRMKCFIANNHEINEYEAIDYVFGGCGGNPSEIIKIYKENFSPNV